MYQMVKIQLKYIVELDGSYFVVDAQCIWLYLLIKGSKCYRTYIGILQYFNVLHRLLLDFMSTEVKEAEEAGSQFFCTAQGNLGGTMVSPEEEEEQATAILMLDHMRSKTRYTQTIQKWAGSLSLNGSLLFVGKLIFIVLQGHSSNIKVRK